MNLARRYARRSLSTSAVKTVGTALLLILLSVQAIAWGDARMVCRYTGRVLTDCPCPPSDEAEDKLKRLDCCLLQASDPAPIAPAVLTSAVHLNPIAAAPLDLQLPAVASRPVVALHRNERDRAPPQTAPLFILHRHLLI